MAETVKVHTNDGKKRVLFEGPDKDARLYVERNFPRAHAEPGVHYEDGPQPDVVLSTGESFHAENGWSDNEKDDEYDD